VADWDAVERRAPSGTTLARTLGWFSIGLGLSELLAPRRLSRLVGSPEQPRLLQALGAREIASGLGILIGRRRPQWMWSRVAGDMIDLALLGAALADRRSERRRVAAAAAAVAGVTALDVLAARRVRRARLEDEGIGEDGELEVRKTLAVNCSPAEAYAFWRNLANLPRFMAHLDAVEVRDERRSHWVARAPGGTTVEWDAEIVEDQPNERISWRSVEGSDVPNSGTVRFQQAPGGRGTLVRVELRYEPPAGELGRSVAKLFGEEPEQQVDADLRRFKQVLEAGEVPTTEGQPEGRRGIAGRMARMWSER
jgi:uncharacterized membrane protein